MITEDYISFETAKLLKEKGFDEYVEWAYRYFAENNICVIHINEKPASTLIENCYPYVTHQMAMKWLREACGLIISIEFQAICSTWKWRIYIKSSNKKHTDFQHYNKYEEACEAAIEYCLINLV